MLRILHCASHATHTQAQKVYLNPFRRLADGESLSVNTDVLRPKLKRQIQEQLFIYHTQRMYSISLTENVLV